MSAISLWVIGKLQSKLGPIFLAGAVIVIGLLVGAAITLGWQNWRLGLKVEAQVAAAARCSADLTASQGNVGVLEQTLADRNAAVEVAVAECRVKDEVPAAKAVELLKEKPRSWRPRAQGMNEWLASK